jgi:Zn-dependent alcohol dehydrogenase
VHEQCAVKLPDGVDEQLTSIIGCAVMTGAGGAFNSAGVGIAPTAHVRLGDSVAVFVVGGVGLSCVQACANAGAYPIIAVDPRDEKLAFARQFGATHFVNASAVDPVARILELTGGVGVDCSFDAIGGPKTLAQVVQVVRAGVNGVSEPGTAALIGNPTGPTRHCDSNGEIFVANALDGNLETATRSCETASSYAETVAMAVGGDDA